MKLNTKIEIHLSNGFMIEDLSNYKEVLFQMNDRDSECVQTLNYIVPKINIDCIKRIKNIEEIEEI